MFIVAIIHYPGYSTSPRGTVLPAGNAGLKKTFRTFQHSGAMNSSRESSWQEEGDRNSQRAVPSCHSRVASHSATTCRSAQTTRSERSERSDHASTRSCGSSSRLWELYKMSMSTASTTTYTASYDPGGRSLPVLDLRRCDVPLGRTKPELIKKLEPGQRGWDRLSEMKLACGTSWNENLATRSNYAR